MFGVQGWASHELNGGGYKLYVDSVGGDRDVRAGGSLSRSRSRSRSRSLFLPLSPLLSRSLSLYRSMSL